MKASVLSPSAKAHLLVFAGAFCISFSALFVQGADMNPSMIAFYRLAFGGGALFLAALARRERVLPDRRMLAYILLAALFFSADLLCWHESIVRIGPGLATITANLQVFFLALYAVLVLRERLPLRQVLAMPLAVAGLLMLLEVNPTAMPPAVAAGVAFGLATAMFYTGYILSVRQSQMAAAHLPPLANMAWISLAAGLVVAAFCQAGGVDFRIPDLTTGLTLAALGIFCQALGWFLLSLGLPHLSPSRAGLILLAQPALSFAWDILFCARPTGPIGYVGAAVALLAIWLGLGGKTGRTKKA